MGVTRSVTGPVSFVTICHLCGTPVESVPVTGGETWQPAVLWGYAALQGHLRDVHPAGRQ